jgi:uncharacterized membrane protein YfcA
MWTKLIFVTMAAFVAGTMNAVAGGGTFLAFPALTAAGVNEKVANMLCTIGLWPGSASSVVAARSEFGRLPRYMVFGYSTLCLIGGAVGAVLLLVTPTAAFSLVIPWLLLFATIIFGFSRPIAHWAGRKHGQRALKWTLIVAGVQGAVAIYGGYFGAGIGVLTLAGLSFTGLEDIHQMNALKVLLSTLTNLSAAIVFLCAPKPAGDAAEWHMAWKFALWMACASTISGFLGMAVARKVKQEQLRILILLCGVLLTGIYFYKNYGFLAARK